MRKIIQLKEQSEELRLVCKTPNPAPVLRTTANAILRVPAFYLPVTLNLVDVNLELPPILLWMSVSEMSPVRRKERKKENCAFCNIVLMTWSVYIFFT